MKRFETFSGYFLTCLGIVLAGVSILVVPADAFADYSEGTCTDCKNGALCCAQTCGSDESCLSACCMEACPLPTEYTDCKAQAKQCPNGNACGMGCTVGCDQSTPAIFREKEAPTRRFG